ncbi:MAG: DNA topoisomerase, partial [Planctomycetota bacterium]|nr:DNA topoisomerase [Planctomycetota bacterium]
MTFFTESKRMVYPGWMLVHRMPKASEQLNDLGVAVGESAVGAIKQISCEQDSTRPPKRYTEAGLLRQMEIATDVAAESFDDIEDEEILASMQGKGLGTPATRAQTIEALVRKGYVLRNGKTLRSAAKGITLIDFLERVDAIDLAKAEQTADMESALYKVEHGDMKREDYMSSIEQTTKSLVDKFVNFSYEELYKDEESVGKCPLDDFDVREGLKGYRCSRRAKGENYRLTIKSLGKAASKSLTEVADIVHQFLAARSEVTEVEQDLKRTNGYLNFTIERPRFVDDYISELGPVVNEIAPADSLKEEFKVEAVEPDACGYTIWKEFRGRFINRPLASRLLKERDSGPIEGFVSMRGESYAGRIKLDPENKLEFEPVKNFKSDDEKGAVGQEEISYEVDETPFV